MNNSNDQQTRESRHKRQKEDRLLNVLIAAVILAILIVGSVVISSNPKSPEKAAEKGQDEEVTEPKEVDETNPTPDEQEADTEQIVSDEEDAETEETEETEETRVITDVSDGIVSQSIVDEAWEPIPTAQQGAHSSSYDRDSVDWQEKLEAISYATGLSEDGMILWKVKNGGSPQKSIGIISSKDQSEKYRVYLEWMDNEGWKPVKMDVLNTLNFDY